MKQERIKRDKKNITDVTYENVCGYLVRVERCQSGPGAWRIALDTAAVVFFVAAWMVWLFF